MVPDTFSSSAEDQGGQMENLDRKIGGPLVANEVQNLQETKGLKDLKIQKVPLFQEPRCLAVESVS